MSDGFSSIDDLLASTRRHQQHGGAVPAPQSGSLKPAATPPLGSTSTPEEVEGPDGPGLAAVEKTEETVEEKMTGFRLDTAEQDTRARASLLGLPYLNLQGFPIGPEVLGLIPEEEARLHSILCFFRIENQIRVAVVNPDDTGIHDIIANLQTRHPGSQVSMYLISQHSFDVALQLYKGVVKVKKVEYGVHITAEQLKRFQDEVKTYSELEQRLQTANMTEAFAMLISMAMNTRSSDVHIEAEEGGAVVRFRIDGVLTEVARLPLNMLGRLVNRIKGIAGLKLNVNTVPQDGRITIEFGEGDNLDIRVSTLPSAYGESIVFRLLRSSSVGLSFEELGIRPLAFQRLKAEIAKPNGMIITTGPTGSGKTTTLYAILNTLNSPDTKIITLENPVEYHLKGVVQSQIDPSKEYTFAKGLRAILRQDPDIVMVGEIRDLETADTAIQAALTGHLMLSTIHTNDATGVIPRFLGMGVNANLLAPSLNAVIGQRLVRRVCTQCAVQYTPSAEELAKAAEWMAHMPENSGEQAINLDSVTWKKGQGCETCGGTGYKGRVGIYEIFTMSAEIEKIILAATGVSEFQMKEVLHRAGMVTMGQDGVLKAVEGVTTLDEVFRVAKE